MRDVLAELPETLDETYERILREIPKTNRVHAHRLLQCLTVAVRPLRVEELAEVLAINFDAEGGIPKLNEGFRWADQEQAILSACSSLIAIVEYKSSDSSWPYYWVPDSGSRRVQFSHFSVKEFLTSDRLATSTVDLLRGHHIRLEPANTIMAKACLGVLLRLGDHMDKETIWSYPLAKYAGECFVDHADFGDVLSHINDGLDDLLDPDKPHFNTWLWLRYGDWGKRQFVWNDAFDYWHESLPNQSNSEHPVPIYPPRIFPLYHVLALGFTCLAQHLILKRPRDVGASDDHGTTALHIAAYRPYCKVAQMLVEHTAAVDVRDDSGRTPLHYATRDGGLYPGEQLYGDIFHCIRLLLDSGASAEAQNKDGSTPLHVAASKMSQEIVQLLIENSTNIDLRNNQGQTVLNRASQRGHLGIIELILNHKADVDALDNDGSTPLHLAISDASLEAVHLLLKHGASVALRNDKGQTALHEASQRGQLDILQLILNHNAEVDALDNDGSTPLHLAISEANVEVVQLLLNHGASVHLQNHMGQTALHKASQRGDLDIIQLLLDQKADLNLQDDHGSIPLHLATHHMNQQVVQLFLQHGADVTLRNDKGQSALHQASQRGQIDIIQLILNHGADVDALDDDGSTPLHLAIPEESLPVSKRSLTGSEMSLASSSLVVIPAAKLEEAGLEVVQLLLRYGADINFQNHIGQTALHKASQRGYVNIIKLMLNHNVDVDAPDHDGSTPLHLAVSKAHLETVQLLLKHGASVHTQNNRGETSFQAASERGLQEITDLLSMYIQREQMT